MQLERCRMLLMTERFSMDGTIKLDDIVSSPEPPPSATDRHKDYQIAFGRRLRKLRKLMGYTQQELANRCTKDRTTITNIETGFQAIGIHTFVELCEAEKLSADIVIWLLTGDERPDLGRCAFGVMDVDISNTCEDEIDD